MLFRIVSLYFSYKTIITIFIFLITVISFCMISPMITYKDNYNFEAESEELLILILRESWIIFVQVFSFKLHRKRGCLLKFPLIGVLFYHIVIRLITKGIKFPSKSTGVWVGFAIPDQKYNTGIRYIFKLCTGIAVLYRY